MTPLGDAVPNRLLELGVSSSVSGTCRHRPIAAVCSSKSQRASGRSRGKTAPKSAAAGGAAPAAAPSAPLPAPPAVLAPPPPPPFKQLMAAPEDFQAPSGQLIPVNVMHPPSPADVFKCIGCARPECQVGRRAAASKLVAGRLVAAMCSANRTAFAWQQSRLPLPAEFASGRQLLADGKASQLYPYPIHPPTHSPIHPPVHPSTCRAAGPHGLHICGPGLAAGARGLPERDSHRQVGLGHYCRCCCRSRGGCQGGRQPIVLLLCLLIEHPAPKLQGKTHLLFSLKLIWHAAPPSPLPACRVYKIAKETSLQEAKQLSKQTGNIIYLKREDLQVGGLVRGGWAGRVAGCVPAGWLGLGSTKGQVGCIVSHAKCRNPFPLPALPSACPAACAVVQGAGGVQQDVAADPRAAGARRHLQLGRQPRAGGFAGGYMHCMVAC